MSFKRCLLLKDTQIHLETIMKCVFNVELRDYEVLAYPLNMICAHNINFGLISLKTVRNVGSELLLIKKKYILIRDSVSRNATGRP